MGGVLFEVKRQQVWQGLAGHSSLSAEAIQQAFMQDGSLILYETGAISSAEFWNQLRRIAQTNLPDSELEPIWQSALSPIEANLNAVRNLTQNHAVALISNTNLSHLQRIYQLAPFLKDLPGSFSHEIGFLKPRSEIFKHALQLCGISAVSAVFIDDRVDNVAAAELMGFQGMQLPEPSLFQSTLNQILEQ